MGKSESVSRYRSSRKMPPNEKRMSEVGLEVTGSTYKWCAELKDSGFMWSAERKCWYSVHRRGGKRETSLE